MYPQIATKYYKESKKIWTGTSYAGPTQFIFSIFPFGT